MAFGWDEELTARLINNVLDQVNRLGASYEGNFKKAVWNRIVLAFNSGLSDDLVRDRKQLQSKLTDLKKKYRIFSAMKNNSGFGWDPTTGMPTAPDSVWEDLLTVHRSAKEFKSRPLIMYEELNMILLRTTATGSFAVYGDNGEGPRPAPSPSPLRSPRSAPSSLSELSSDSDAEAEIKTEEAVEDERTVIPKHNRRRNIQGNKSTGSTTKRQKTTGEKMSDAMATMASAQDLIASTILHRRNRGRPLTCSDEAIHIFKEMFTDKIAVADRFKFIRLLDTDPNAATIFYGMDDESRNYMVGLFIAEDHAEDRAEEHSD